MTKALSFGQRLAIGMCAALFVWGTVAYFAYQRSGVIIATSLHNQNHARRVQQEADKLLRQFVGMETGARSFLITGDSLHLLLYARTVGEVPLTLKRLRLLLEPLTPETASVLKYLDSAFDGKILEASQAIALRRMQGIKISAYVIAKGKHVNAADTLVHLIQHLQEYSRRRAISQYEALPSEFQRTVMMILYGFGAGVGILGISVLWARRVQHQAIQPITEGLEKLVLGDVHHRVPATTMADMKPLVSAVNLLAEHLASVHTLSRSEEGVYADIVHAIPEAISVWRAVRNGYGQIIDFECQFAN
ncbi:MAG: CHASE3 domain-containing protein, partial [Bacteroidota bacterium]|nr:CHASE3 domain-containing protein [Candidatus Kapabacteria bacterium]MDW8221306.1 CHASE3 domain-containing protein [Bacteroidota bacterium]